jgi:hypothetical protein
MAGHAHQAETQTSPPAAQSDSGDRSALNRACGCKTMIYTCQVCEGEYYKYIYCPIADREGATGGPELCTNSAETQKIPWEMCSECRRLQKVSN